MPVFDRPNGETYFQELSEAHQPVPSGGFDAEFNAIADWMNDQISITANTSEWCVLPTTPTYVSGTQFRTSGNTTTTFVASRAVRADLDGSFVYGYVSASAYDGGTGLTTVTLKTSVLTSDLTGIAWGILSGNAAAKSYPDNLNAYSLEGTRATATPTASKIPIADASGLLNGWVTFPDVTVLGGLGRFHSKLRVEGNFNTTSIGLEADQMMFKKGTTLKVLAFPSATINISASGLLGLDTGTLDADTWYYIWGIAKDDDTVSAIISLSASAPTLPAGYTWSVLLGAARSNASKKLVGFRQRNSRVTMPAQLILAEAAYAGTSLDDAGANIRLSAVVPPLDLVGGIRGYIVGQGANVDADYYLTDASGSNGHAWHYRSDSATVEVSFELQTDDAVYPAFTTAVADGDAALYCTGWDYL